MMSDGKTPAFGARALLLLPGQPYPAGAAMVGADGVAAQRWQWQFPNGARALESIKEPTLVAWLPGHTGPALMVLRDGKDLAPVLKLPGARKVTGRVSIGGKPVEDRTGSLRVFAQPLEPNDLLWQFVIDVSAQADGSFELAGLNAGKYRVQAALDNIWLSASQEVTGPAAEPLTIDIPQPGGPAIIEVADQAGAPAKNVKVTLDRPVGPLCDLLWPKEIEVDSAGKAYVPALEAGEHTLRVQDRAVTVTVRSLRESKGEPVVAKMKLAPESSRD
jgi:hypothetical protein